MTKQPRVRQRQFVPPSFEMDIVTVMTQLFPAWFGDASWDNWRTVLRAAYALPMSESEIEFFKSIAGGRAPPARRVKELWCVCGRRSGKSAITSLIAAHSAVFFRAGIDKLRIGERAQVQVLACDKGQAAVVRDFIAAYFDFLPALRSMVHRRTVDTLELVNDVDVVTATNSYRSVRGKTVLVSVFDEVAYWRDENTATPDSETYAAVRPSLLTLPNSMLCAISSPGKKSGLLYSKWKKHFGVNDAEVLVIQAPSLVMNPTLDEEEIRRAYEDDPVVARSELGSCWRDDLVNFVDVEVVEGCVMPGVRELPRVRGVVYQGFVDPSGGSSDSMAMAIAHNEGGRVVIDLVREVRPPFGPDIICAEFAMTLKGYGVGSVVSDKYAGEWVIERFAAHGIRVEQSAEPKSTLYQALLPLLNSKRIDLLDHPRTIAQICSLERRVARGSGRDVIDHPPNAHDDLANCIAGVSWLVLGNQGVTVSPELLAQVQAMAPRRPLWANRRVGRIMFQPPADRRCMPSSVLPAEKFSQPATTGEER